MSYVTYSRRSQAGAARTLARLAAAVPGGGEVVIESIDALIDYIGGDPDLDLSWDPHSPSGLVFWDGDGDAPAGTDPTNGGLYPVRLDVEEILGAWLDCWGGYVDGGGAAAWYGDTAPAVYWSDAAEQAVADLVYAYRAEHRYTPIPTAHLEHAARRVLRDAGILIPYTVEY